jgi:hypothetical protein
MKVTVPNLWSLRSGVRDDIRTWSNSVVPVWTDRVAFQSVGGEVVKEGYFLKKEKIMNIKKVLIFLCAFVFLFGLSSVKVQVYAQDGVAFIATELLGRPTAHSVTVNVLADANLEAYFEYGTTSGVYTDQTGTITSTANEPIEVVIDGLQSNTRYYYRMVYREVGATDWIARDEHSFHTQRPPGNTFTFTAIADSHLGFGDFTAAHPDLYNQTLLNVLADNPDFHIDLGDTFLMDGVSTIAQAQQAYLDQRPYMGLISHSAPIFLALGNHENEEGWNLDDTPSLPLLSANARKLYYPNPVPDGFYSGNTDTLAAIDGDGLREDYYAWQWGDALFVVLDPFWYTMAKPYSGGIGGELNDETVIGDRWDWTLGEQQYLWFKQTLEGSSATFKFVFAHHVTGGTQPYVRGGAEAAPYFEWGGLNWDGTWGFGDERPGWDNPIHQLMVQYGVTAFFHGHDHEYAKEEKDGIVYQLCPQPGDSSYGYGFNLYHESDPYTDVVLPNSGHLRVTVSPSQVTVDYVRAYLPGDGTNGEVAYSYTIEACQFDSDCDDGLYCNGAETCVGGTCQAGSDPCPGQYCDEENDECVAGPTAQLESGAVTVGGDYATVNLANTYVSPVVVCSVQYYNNSTPVVARVSDVTSTSFKVRLQNPSGGTVVAENVSYLVVEEGTWTIDGVNIEAQTYLSTVTDENSSWVGEPQSYGQSYTNPVVLGQVMSENDAGWSVFWCQGGHRTIPPSASVLRTGKTVGEDTDTTRADETIGIIVFEAGHGTIGGVEFEALVSADAVRGVTNSPPYAYSFDTAFSSAPQVAVTTMAGMDGYDGGWAYVQGSALATTTGMYLWIDEDQIGDSERDHTTEQVGYVVFETAVVYP